MSLGACFCPCVINEHEPSICTGEADTSRPRKPSLADNVELPVCFPCANKITNGYDNPLVAPLGSGHTPDMPAVTPSERRSAASNWPRAPLPPGRQ